MRHWNTSARSAPKSEGRKTAKVLLLLGFCFRFAAASYHASAAICHLNGSIRKSEEGRRGTQEAQEAQKGKSSCGLLCFLCSCFLPYPCGQPWNFFKRFRASEWPN